MVISSLVWVSKLRLARTRLGISAGCEVKTFEVNVFMV